jgi:hypothetical protein
MFVGFLRGFESHRDLFKYDFLWKENRAETIARDYAKVLTLLVNLGL